MALVKPLGLYNGEIQEIPLTDTLSAVVSEVDAITKVAAATLIAGQVVYASSATQVDKAAANADATAKPIGLATAAISSAASGSIQTSGVITLTTGQWDALCGTTGGLTFGTVYYLSATAGLLTATAPTTSGHYVVAVIEALSPTEANIIADYTKRVKKA